MCCYLYPVVTPPVHPLFLPELNKEKYVSGNMKLHLASPKKCVNIQLYILYKEEISHKLINIVLMFQILNLVKQAGANLLLKWLRQTLESAKGIGERLSLAYYTRDDPYMENRLEGVSLLHFRFHGTYVP